MNPTPNMAEWLNGKVQLTAQGCWEWTGSRNATNYGYLRFDGANRLAHRVVYAEMVGPIPEGYVICHRCDNPPCVSVSVSAARSVECPSNQSRASTAALSSRAAPVQVGAATPGSARIAAARRPRCAGFAPSGMR